jgi:hypothetical protein
MDSLFRERDFAVAIVQDASKAATKAEARSQKPEARRKENRIC